jgi:RND family efflux transporter MFP subunit
MDRRRFRLVRIIGAFALGVAASANATSATAQRAALVSIDKVRSEQVSQTIPVIGRIVARRAGVVAARVGAPVAEIKVEVGDRVGKGDAIAVLVNDRLRWERERRAADVAEQSAKLNSQESEMALKQQELERLDRLKKNKSAAFRQALYDDKQLEANMLAGATMEARARLKRAEADLGTADLDLRNTTIRAPYAGVITLKHVEAGAFVSAGTPVVTIVDDQTMEIEADVPADRLSGLRSGTQVAVQVFGQTLAASVRAIVPQENPLTRTRAVRFTPEFETGARHFASNQSVTVSIPLGAPEDIVSVHKDAVLGRPGGNMVFVVEDGKATPRPIAIGDAVGQRFVVTEGLKEGEIVVVRGNERLFPGQPVKF